MSEQGTATSGLPQSRHLPQPGHELVGCVRDRLGRHHPGDRHRARSPCSSMGAAAIPAIALVVVIGLIVCLCMGELAALLPHRTGGMPSYAYESFEPLGHTTAQHIGGVSGWGYWLGWFPVAPINMLLAAGYIAVLFHVPLGRSFSPLGTLGTPGLHGCARHHLRRADWAVHPLLPRHPARGHVRHHPRGDVDGARSPC